MLYQCTHCKELSDINIDSSYVCSQCNRVVNLYDPNDFVIVGDVLKQYKGTNPIVIIPKEVRVIGSFAFSLSRSIEKVYLHENIYRIETEAFSKSLNFKNIFIPKTVLEIGDYAFSRCEKLTILTEYQNKPLQWSSIWNSTKNPVIWGMKDYKIDDLFHYVINRNNEIYLLELIQKDIEFIDLSNIYENPIKGICRCCFSNAKRLKNIILPKTLEFIGKFTFANCRLLNSINLPKSLKTLGKYAFDSCVSLNEIVIPSNLRRLEMDSFSNGNLKSLTVTSSRTSILKGIEWNRRNLERLILPKEMTEISELIFKSCTSLSFMRISKKLRGKFTIPTRCVVEEYEDENSNKQANKMIRILERIDKGIGVKVTFLDRRAYRYNCYFKVEVGDIVYAIYKGQKIKGVVVDYLDQISTMPNVNTITEVYRMVPDDYDFNKLDQGFFNNQKTIDKLIFALDRLKEGSVSDYYEQFYLKYIKDVLYINGNNVLKYLLDNYEYDYINIIYENNLITHNLESIIEYCVMNNHVMIIPLLLQYNYEDYKPNFIELTSDYIIANEKCIDEVNISNNIKLIKKDSFKNTYIRKINYHGSIENYLKLKFENEEAYPLLNNGELYYFDNQLVKLTKLIIPSEISNINDFAFSFLDSLEEVIFNDKITKIGKNAFYSCINLQKIDLPNSIIEIGCKAFSNCGIKKIIIPDNVLEIKNETFRNCRDLKEIVLPDSIINIEEMAFYSCINLSNILIPKNVKIIGDSTFANCRSLASVILPNSLKVLGSSCFLACTNLKEVVLSNQLTAINQFTFRMCSSLERIVLTNSIAKVGSFAFDKCTKLMDIKLTNSIRTIGLKAFKDCISLNKFLIPLGMESIGLCAFENCTGLRVVYIPKSVYSIENNAFIGCKNLIICLEISESEKNNELYKYFGLNNLLSSCITKWNYKINRK